GLGALSGQDDPDAYDRGFLHCDLLVIGAGPAGLAAALTAGRAGARVILADEDSRAGGRLNAEQEAIGQDSAADWAAEAWAELDSLPNVRLMRRSTVIGAWDHGIYGVLERVAEHATGPSAGAPRQILWRVYTQRAILCSGATERSIAFADNDRPGILQAGALRAYMNRWAAAPSDTIAVFTNNDDGHRTARDALTHGLNVAAVIDTRAEVPESADFRVIAGAEVCGSWGRRGLKGITYRKGRGTALRLECGALGVSGGWNPNVHLTCHHRGRPVWQEDIAAFVPAESGVPGLSVAGAAAGLFSTQAALSSGARAAAEALNDIGRPCQPAALPEAEDAPVNITPFWLVETPKTTWASAWSRAWIDPQNDVTHKDIKQALQENFRSVEHLKRYTTLGMATDQGKIGNVLGLGVMAEVTGAPVPQTGTTIYRPPYTPVPIAAFAGRSARGDFRPTRRTPSHAWAEEQGAVFTEAGLWLRAQYFPQAGETTWRETVDREVLAVRAGVGICDVTTLGKIDVQGADAAEYLNQIYANGFAKLPVGKCRYGLMLREDGLMMDDGTAARLAEQHYVVTTTTANAGPVLRHMDFVRQCLMPSADVQIVSTTEVWAQVSIAGPNARALLSRIVDLDLSAQAFPFMACTETRLKNGVKARLFRISFSGELAFELAVPTRYGDALMRALMAEGADLGVTPYGTEALGVMRIEKGHVAGNELNGTTTALELGLGGMVSSKKDAIGRVLSQREGLVAEDGLRLVGLKPADGKDALPAGAHLFTRGTPADAEHDQGYITSACFSPVLGHPIALALLRNGRARHGEVIRVSSPLTGVESEADVVSPHFVDPEGGRQRG
ncbi:MAG: glycine cleavage T C-terminal barrel domain-containing protein, partial [Pseudomonadota bacterium]